MTGLKICTRWRAISARFSRRISSSLFPENMGPTMTSIQPMFPFTMSTFSPLTSQSSTHHCENTGALLTRINRCIEKSREGGDGSGPKCILPRHLVPCHDAPRYLRVPNPVFSGQGIHGRAQFHAALQHFGGEGIRHFDSSGTAERPHT